MPPDPPQPHTSAEQGIRDLMGLLSLPALWVGRDGGTIIQITLEAAERVVPLAFAYLETAGLAEQPVAVRLRVNHGQADEAQLADWQPACRRMVDERLPDGRVFEADTPAGSLRVLRLSMGYGQSGGKILFGSMEQDFPTFNQLAFLRAATSLAATGLHAARIAHEREQASRAKDEFLAMLAHELRNPLAPISAAADLLSMGSLDMARVSKASGVIRRQVRHMTSLVDDLLDVSRVTRGLVVLNKGQLDAKHIVTQALEQAQPLMEARRHRVSVELPSGPAIVCGDEKRLVQVLVNLLNNAAKYTPADGRIELRIGVEDGAVAFEVADNGIGMTVDMVRRAFELFVQAERTPDRAQGGLGLGLPLVKSLVELHEGKVTAHSDGAGMGTRVRVLIPRSEPAQGAGEAVAGLARRRSAGGLRLLLVDDNIDAASTLAMCLEAAGHHVVVAHEGQRALEAALASRPQACLLDIGLPGMDGYELGRRLKNLPEAAGATLIALTGYGGERDREASARAGFAHHMVKPVDLDRLGVLLAEVAQARA